MVDRKAFRETEIKARGQAVTLAIEMLSGRLSYLEGAPRILALQSKIGGLEDRDHDFDVFVLIASETDHLPLEKQRALWSSAALERLTPEFERAEKWAAQFAPEACRNIIARFDEQAS